MHAMILAFFAAALAAATPGTTVSPLVVSATPSTKIAPHPDVTITSAGSDDFIGDATAVWPREAYGVGKGGRVTLSCRVDTHGLAESCTVVAEQPQGLGFGRAALEMRPTFKVKPPAAATTMVINVAFRAPNTDVDGSGFAVAAAASRMGAGPVVSSITGNKLEMHPVVMIDNPVWASAADFDDLTKAYPSKGGGAEGYVAVHCQVERTGGNAGAVHGCQIMKETPRGHDFGRAALSLMPKFRVLPAVLAHAPTDAPLWVDVPVRLPPPQAIADRTVMAPVWLMRFDAASAMRVFPPEAIAKGLTTGQGVARCTVGGDGALTACVPEPGDPDGLGFSEAAVKLASAMRMNLWSADGAPVEGGVVHIPIRLRLRGEGL
jgi:TonB family protein